MTRKHTYLPEQPLASMWQPFELQQQQEGEQQQQQDDPPIPTPFDGIDIDLLDDATKAKITQAKTEFAMIAKSAKEAKTHQEKIVLLEAEIAKNKANPNSPSVPAKQNADPTLEDEIAQAYREAGMTDEKVIAANVKLQMNVLGKFSNRLGGTLNGVIQPLQQNAQEMQANQHFNSMRVTDPRLANDDIAQAVWEKVDKFVKGGGNVSPELIANFAKIAWVDLQDKNPNDPSPTLPVITRMQSQQTRHSFPGAGHSPSLPNNRPDPNLALDSDTAAAVAATLGHWPDQLQKKLNASNGNNKQSIVTRGTI